LTLNNLSCSYKRNGNIEEAQKCLKKALELQETMADDIAEQLDTKFEGSP
jgi:Tfp pilus assembly protein PilF